MRSLQEFYNDKETSDNVKNYLVQTLEEIAVKRVFAKEGTEGLADAKEVIETAFANMEMMFAKKVDPKVINEAR